jgi:hypothetical protein
VVYVYETLNKPELKRFDMLDKVIKEEYSYREETIEKNGETIIMKYKSATNGVSLERALVKIVLKKDIKTKMKLLLKILILGRIKLRGIVA